MAFEKIKNCGELGIEFNITGGEGSQVSKDFLTQLLNNFVKRSFKYFDETKDHIFIYREKQLHSVICPSIADITPAFVMEHPLSRKPAGDDEYLGLVDYWVSYRNYTFLIELKHTYFAYRNAESPKQSISSNFKSALKQLDEIRLPTSRDVTINRGLIKVALQVIVFYESSNEKIDPEISKDRDFKQLFNKLIKNTELKDKANLMSLWLLNNKLIDSVEYNGRHEIYPAVAFVGKIFDVIK